MSEKISLSITGREPLVFEGKMLVRVSSERDRVPEGERGYDLTVYSRRDGGYVATIDFVTTLQDERNQSVVESVDALDDVEDVFFAFEPEELLPQSIKAELTAAQRQALLQRLYANYDARVRDVLQRLHKEVEQPKTSPSTV